MIPLDPTKDYRPEIQKLSRTLDLFGRGIGIGTKVRWFQHARVNPDGTLSRIAQEGDGSGAPTSYSDGVVEAIGKHTIDQIPRYTVRRTREVTWDGAKPRVVEDHQGLLYPPLNGSLAWDDWVYFGVMVL